jgi:hypothetical protein
LNCHEDLITFAAFGDEQFLTPAHRAMLTVERESESLLDRLAAIKHLPIPKSIQR